MGLSGRTACRTLCCVDGDEKPGQFTRSGAITVQDTVDGQVLRLSGDVEDVVVKHLMATCSVDLSRIVAVDVGELAYIDSTALTLLVRWARGSRGRRPARRDPP